MSDHTAPQLVSIVMCTWNGERFLGEQMDSLLAQSWPKLEIIVVDDASSDGTFAILQQYALQDQRVKIFRNEKNLGYNQNFRKACTLANGDYIAISDQDDIWEANKISLLMELMRDHPDVILAHSPSAIFETGKSVQYKSATSRIPFRGNDVRKFFLFNHISGHNMLFRKTLLNEALPFPEHVYYDWWLAIVACCHGEIAYTDKILAYHRIHPENESAISGSLRPFYIHVLETLPVFLTAKGLPAEAKRFGQKLLAGYESLQEKKFSLSLFRFILAHAKIIFSFKKKKFPWFSYIKHSRRISSATYLKRFH